MSYRYLLLASFLASMGSAAGAVDLKGLTVKDAYVAGQLTVILEREFWNSWRAYFGGERFFSIEPADVKKNSLHGGLEFRSGRSGRRHGRWIAGIDLKSFEHHDWNVDWSLKAGYEFAAASEGQRLRVLAEAYDGFAPHGQFYNAKASFYGVGVYFGH